MLMVKLSCKWSRQILLIIAGSMLLMVSISVSASDLTWKISLTPKGGGEVQWKTDLPDKSGVLTGSGSITMTQSAMLDLTFVPYNGYKLESVFKNSDNWTPYLDPDNHYRFGPVSNSHNIVVKFSEIIPTGSIDLQSPESLPDGVAPIYNATGHYSGTVPTGVPLVSGKTFEADVAMDESGKLDILPISLEDFTPTDNKPIIGSLKTVNNLPQVTVSASFKGVFDGIGGEGAGSATLTGMQALPRQGLQAIPANNVVEPTLDASGTGVYKMTLKNTDTRVKTSFKEKNVDVQLPVVTDVSKNWSVNLLLSQRKDAKDKLKTYAEATLTLPTGESVAFAERTVNYSMKKGYNLSFSKGINQTSQLVDKKTKLSIKKMLFDCSSQPCQVSDGQIQYRFLGQQGQANLTDFIDR